MRLLILQTELFATSGGIQTFNRTLVRAAGDLEAQRDLTTRVLVLNDHGAPDRAHAYLGARTSLRTFGGSKVRFALAAVAESMRADVVLLTHVHLSPIALALRLLRPATRFCVVLHGVDVWKRLPVALRAGVAGMDRVLSVSRFTLDLMQEKNGPLSVPASIFPCSLDSIAAAVRPAPVLPDLPSGRFLLSVARLAQTERRKGIDVVIRAMPAILAAHPDVSYVVAGDGGDRNRLERLALETGVASRVAFLGRVPDTVLATLYERCEIFVLPSSKEGFGIVFLEAMSRGKPCVGVRAGGVPEVVADGETGLLAAPDDPADLARCVAHMLADRALGDRLGNAGRERHRLVFSRGPFAQRLGTLLDELGGVPFAAGNTPERFSA